MYYRVECFRQIRPTRTVVWWSSFWLNPWDIEESREVMTLLVECRERKPIVDVGFSSVYLVGCFKNFDFETNRDGGGGGGGGVRLEKLKWSKI